MNIQRFKNRCFLIVQKTVVFVLFFVLAFSDIQSILHVSFLPVVEKAEAATGDFSIFSELLGTDTIDPNKAVMDVNWDTSVSASANIPIQANNSDIKLTDGGKYLVTYNAKFEEGTSTSANRKSVSSWLSVGGVDIPYGRGSAYIRDSVGLVDAYISGGAIIDATANDNLQVHMARDDVNTGAGTNRAANTDAINVIKLKDGWDYLRLYTNATTSGVQVNTSFTGVQWNTSDEVDTGSFGFTPTSQNITLKGDAGSHFLITTNVVLHRDDITTTRMNYETQLTLAGTEVPGTRVTGYLRGSQSGEEIKDATISYMGIVTKTSSADQTLVLEMRRESTASQATDIVPDKTAISIVAIPDTGSYIRLTDNTGTQALSLTAQDVGWNSQEEVDSEAFSHSTTTGNSTINIDAAGDYIFFSTIYSTTTNGANRRQPFTANWKESGGAVNRGSFGSYNRNNQNNSGGSSGAVLLNNLTDSSFIDLEFVDESTSAPVDAVLGGNRIAIQGLLLDENFFGTDVFVSATGTHAIETDLPITDFYAGGGFVITEKSSSRSVTSITLTESGTVDAQNGLDNIKLYYDLDTTGADDYDCSSESYDGDETQFGSTDTNGFSGADGTSSFSGSVSITTTQTMCVYAVYDVTASSADGQTVALSINNPGTDVGASGVPSIGPSGAVSVTGSTVLQNAELTQTHYNWRNDDGSETAATSIEGTEDTAAIGFSNGTTRRLRLGVSAEGSTSTPSTQYRLEYAQKVTTCDAVVSWIDVGTGGGGDWDIVNTANLTDGNDTTNVVLQANGGISDPAGGFFLSPNGGQKDTSSQTGDIMLTSGDFTELEFALEPTVTAVQGNTYCFRVSDSGANLRNYDVYAEGTISADIDVSAINSQVASLDVGSTNQYVGGAFVIERPGSNRTLTSITLSENGTIDALNDLDNIELWYDLDTTAPYDCTGEAYTGVGETQFGATDATGFSAADGTSVFSGSQALSSTRSLCGYVLLDVGSAAEDGQTINIEISDPSADVVVTGSSVGPSSSVEPTGSTTVSGPILTQTHYHWRNDDGDETNTGATSASGGVEDAAITDVPKESTRRLRLQVSNEGGVSSAATQYILEYGTKVTTCNDVSSWKNVGATGGAFDMSLSANIADGNTTNLTNSAFGDMTEENTTFVGTGALRETEATSSAITLSSTQFTELEYSIEATADAGDLTTYCFRVSNEGADLKSYTTYAEFITREKQDFYIQRGVTMVSGTSLTLTAGIDYTVPSSATAAFVRITNSQMTGAGNDTGGGNTNSDDVTAYISNPGNIVTNFTITRPGTAINNTRVSWEIVEYVGLDGADNEMIVRDASTVTYGASTLTASGASIGTVTDDADVVVFITGQLNPAANTTNYNDGSSVSSWNATTTQPDFVRGDADAIATQLSYAVVEFTGANWNIQRIVHTYAASGVTETETMSAVSSLNSTFVHAQKQTGNGLAGLDEFGHSVWLSSIGQVSFRIRAGATTPADHTSVAWVMENTQTGDGAMTVYRSNGTIASGGTEPESNTVGIGGTINMANASLFVTNDSSGTGTAFPRTILGAAIINTTQYELWNSDTGQSQDYRTEVVEWPVAEVSVRQNYYRFYVDNDLLDPTDPYPSGASDLGENTSITGADDPLGEGEKVRIRMTLHINNATLPESVRSFKLQFGKRITSCSAIGTWTDLGDPGAGEIWRGYDGTPVDGTELATGTPAPGTLNISVSDVAGSYEEQNNSVVNPYSVDIGEDVEYDWLVEHNGATQLSDYCFRMTESDGSLLDGYDNYPTLRTTGYTPVIGKWRWYDDSTNVTPSSALGVEEETPVNLVPDNEIKLRATAIEVEGAPGVNVKFRLQYSEYADFSAGVYEVDASHLCAATSTWCYVDGAGVDNAVIDSALLSDADSCVAGVGNGCGLHNEIATTTTTHAQPSLSSMEFEFTLKPSNPRVNAVYYFRMYDVTNDVSVSASSSYPSIQMEGANLVFTLGGLDSGVTTEGVVTDATTTATSILLDSIPFDTEFEAAHRLTIDTNATEGYQILMYADQDLTNTYGAIVPAVTASNATPLGWSTTCLVSATGCFGYHAGDDLLQGGDTRFGADDSYAAFNATPQEVMYSSIPINESHDIVYKIQIGQEQPAGDYQKTITYIAVPVF